MLNKMADKRVTDCVLSREEIDTILLAGPPELIGTVGVYPFYECPIWGDETTLLVIDKYGNWGYSYWYELPDESEIQ